MLPLRGRPTATNHGKSHTTEFKLNEGKKWIYTSFFSPQSSHIGQYTFYISTQRADVARDPIRPTTESPENELPEWHRLDHWSTGWTLQSYKQFFFNPFIF